MKDLRSRVAYLQGLSAGLELNTASREGRMISEMLSVFGDLAETVTALASEHDDLETYVDVLDTELQDLEDEVFGDGMVDPTAGEEGDDDVVTGYRVQEWVAGDPGPCEVYGEPLGSGSRIADAYVCPSCGEHVACREDDVADLAGTVQGSIALRLQCPGCGTTFCCTEPGTVTYVDAEDELTDLPYPTKE